jgi:protein SCO1/2
MSRSALVALIVLVTGIAAGTLWYVGDQIASDRVSVTSIGHARVGGPFSLTDQNGHTRTDKDFIGHYMLVYFGYTNCPDVCPTTLSVMADAMEKLGGAAHQVVPIFITVDPARDTPRVLKSYLAAFGPEFVGLTGSPSSIAAVAKEYHVYYRVQNATKSGSYAVNHSNVIYLMSPEGKFIANYDETLGPDKLAAAIAHHIGA